MRGGAVLCGRVRYGTVRCGAKWCGVLQSVMLGLGGSFC